MKHASGDAKILCGLIEAGIGGAALAGLLAAAFVVTTMIVPDVSQQVAQMTARPGALASR